MASPTPSTKGAITASELLKAIRSLGRNPKFVLSAVAVIGLLANIVYYVVAVHPARDRYSDASAQLRQANAQVEAIRAQPLPEPVTREKIEALLQQVPPDADSTRALRRMIELEQATGVEIVEFKGMASFEDLSLREKVERLSQSPAPSASPSPTPAPASAEAGKLPVETYQIAVTGTYAQTQQFLAQLHAGERLSDVRTLTLEKVEQGVKLMLQVDLYVSDQHAKRLEAAALRTDGTATKPTPVPKPSGGAAREDPMGTEADLLNQVWKKGNGGQNR